MTNFKISQFSVYQVTLVLNICLFLKFSWYCVFEVPFIEFGWKLAISASLGRGEWFLEKQLEKS